VPDDIRAVSFHTAVRGYDRREVDRYVERVNRVIAELQITRSPESAVRHALDRVGEQTSGILQHARETADEITHTARTEAEDTTARVKAGARDVLSEANRRAEQIVADADTEAAEHRAREEERLAKLRREAESEIRELREHIDAIRDERGRVIGEIHELAARLERLTADAAEPATDDSAR
jgi:DivIVA domain-containing protein